MKISIIIPVYNKIDYVEKSLGSALSQDFDDFEVVAVDDGSTDGSGAFCDDWAQRDKRLKVIHQQNGGDTSARRTGLSHAIGQYIMFCDADDQLLPNALSTAYNAMIKHKADEVMGAFQNQYGNITISKRLGKVNPNDLIDDILGNRQSFPMQWAILFKRELIEGIFTFPREINEGPDKLFQIIVLLKKPNVYIIDTPLYLYNIGVPNGRKHSVEYEKRFDILLKQILEPEWSRFQDGFKLHMVKIYEYYLDLKQYEAFSDYYCEFRKQDLSRIPFKDRLVVMLPPKLAGWLVRNYKRWLRWKERRI